MKNIIALTIALFAILSPLSAHAEESTIKELFNVWVDNIDRTWRCPKALDVYVPVSAWHNRLTYDQDKIDEYNEFPLGAGAGVSRLDDDGDWHGLYFMAFKDSNYHLQTIFGYAYQKNWYFGEEEDWHAGVGFTTSLTQRSEYAYIPVPLPLPLAGVGYKNINVQAAYVPGIKNDGNVLFTWTRVSF
jgi:palmitoyl transferase